MAPPYSRSAARPLPGSIDFGQAIERVSHSFQTLAEGLSAQSVSRTYTARLEEVGLRLTPRWQGPGRSDTDDAVFRTRTIRHGTRELYDGRNAAPAWWILGNTAQALLHPGSGVVEHYEAKPEGVAVTWVFSEPLRGVGSLVVEAELTGVTYAGQSEHGHHFADETGKAKVRVGKAQAVDAQGRHWPLRTYADGTRLEVTVPESLLREAEFPLAIDPVIGPEFGMDDPVWFASRFSQENPAVASDGSDFLVVWQDDRASEYADIVATRVSASGTVLDPEGIEICTAANTQSGPAVSSNGKGYLVVWTDYRNSPVPSSTSGHTEEIYATRVTSEGLVLDAEGIALDPAANSAFDAKVASDGNDTWRSGWKMETSAAPASVLRASSSMPPP